MLPFQITENVTVKRRDYLNKDAGVGEGDDKKRKREGSEEVEEKILLIWRVSNKVLHSTSRGTEKRVLVISVMIHFILNKLVNSDLKCHQLVLTSFKRNE